MVTKSGLIWFLQEVRCDDDELQQVLQTAVKNLYQAIAPVKQAGWPRPQRPARTGLI